LLHVEISGQKCLDCREIGSQKAQDKPGQFNSYSVPQVFGELWPGELTDLGEKAMMPAFIFGMVSDQASYRRDNVRRLRNLREGAGYERFGDDHEEQFEPGTMLGLDCFDGGMKIFQCWVPAKALVIEPTEICDLLHQVCGKQRMVSLVTIYLVSVKTGSRGDLKARRTGGDSARCLIDNFMFQTIRESQVGEEVLNQAFFDHCRAEIRERGMAYDGSALYGKEVRCRSDLSTNPARFGADARPVVPFLETASISHADGLPKTALPGFEPTLVFLTNAEMSN